jgi:hypothetical protein
MIVRFAAAGLIGLFAITLAHANLVSNPGFESCNNPGDAPPSWTSGSSYCSFNPHSGTWDGDFGGTGATLSQIISTIIGDEYDFQFWLWDVAITPNSFSASFGSDTVLSLTNAPNSPYTLEDFTVTATATSTQISFTGTASGNGWSLDDVSVTDLGPAAPTAPEPSTFLLACSLLGFAGLRRMARR